MHLLTPRLVLRALAPADLSAFVAYRSDPLVARYQGWEAPYSREDAELLFSGANADLPPVPGEWRQVGIARRADGELLGDCAYLLGAEGPEAEIGVTLARAHQGQGYAQEALSALFGTLRETLGMRRLIARCDPRNEPVLRLFSRLGFVEDSRCEGAYWSKGEWVGEVCLSRPA